MQQTQLLANAVLMVPPKGFGFNQQTAIDNAFQQQPNTPQQQLREQVMEEYRQMCQRLQHAGVKVVELDVPEVRQQCPDAVFPNNWLMTNGAGELHCFPMFTANRREEVKPQQAMQILVESGFDVKTWIDYRNVLPGQVLEGTGVMILDHQNKRIFAALSERCTAPLLNVYVEQQGYALLAFNSADNTGTPIYHTNVMLSIGVQHAIVCADVIIDKQQRTAVLSALKQTHQVLEISEQQMRQHFCANVLQLRNSENQRLWVMSESAYNGFTSQQIKQLQMDSELIINPIPTIEQVGGGSCRCMLAEIFLPQLKTH